MDTSYQEFLNDHEAIFKQVTQKLTNYQINYILAYLKGERKFTSQRVLVDYELGSPGNIKRMERALEEAEIMDYSSVEPVFCDPYFEPLFTRHFIK